MGRSHIFANSRVHPHNAWVPTEMTTPVDRRLWYQKINRCRVCLFEHYVQMSEPNQKPSVCWNWHEAMSDATKSLSFVVVLVLQANPRITDVLESNTKLEGLTRWRSAQRRPVQAWKRKLPKMIARSGEMFPVRTFRSHPMIVKRESGKLSLTSHPWGSWCATAVPL